MEADLKMTMSSIDYPTDPRQVYAWIDYQVWLVIEGGRQAAAQASGAIADAIMTALEWLVEKFNEVIAWCRENLFGIGDTALLDEASNAWARDIKQSAIALARLTAPASLQSDNAWTGRGATAYADSADAQSKRYDNLADMAQAVADALSSMSTATMAAGVAVVAGVATFGTTVAISIPCVATVVGTPAGLGAVTVGLATLLISLLSSFAILTLSAGSIANDFETIAANDMTWPMVAK